MTQRIAEPPVLARGELVAPGYRVVEHLSRARRLDAYEVWSDEREAGCVAKVLRPDRAGEAGARAALLAEGRRLREFSHPHLVRAYDVIEHPHPVVILETLEGETVAHLIDREPSGLDADEVAWLGLHLVSALGYLHRHGLLHLDVKPANVIAEAGRAKLIDLSIARPPGPMRAGGGTWVSMAPEQATGGHVDEAADVWGLATVLFEAAGGRPPFELPDVTSETLDTGGRADAGYPQLDGPAPPLASAAPGVPAPLAAIVDACLRPAALDRPSLADVRAALIPLAPGAAERMP
jgi:serine/threonine protein kinase